MTHLADAPAHVVSLAWDISVFDRMKLMGRRCIPVPAQDTGLCPVHAHEMLTPAEPCFALMDLHLQQRIHWKIESSPVTWEGDK